MPNHNLCPDCQRGNHHEGQGGSLNDGSGCCCECVDVNPTLNPEEIRGEEEAQEAEEQRHEQPVLGCDCHDCIR
jgi:hypothetical protein